MEQKRDNEKHRPRQTGFVGKDAVDVKKREQQTHFCDSQTKKNCLQVKIQSILFILKNCPYLSKIKTQLNITSMVWQ